MTAPRTKPALTTGSPFALWLAAGLAILATVVILAVAFFLSLPFTRIEGELSGWVQATGSVLAIVAGFVGVLYQVDAQRRQDAEQIAATGRAAHSLALGAFELVTDRLNAALQPGKGEQHYVLRGLRTTEMVTAMREFETGSLPAPLISPFALLRSSVFAINERISEIYTSEADASPAGRKALRARRAEELRSALRAHAAAENAAFDLDKLANEHCKAAIRLKPLPDLVAAQRALAEAPLETAPRSRAARPTAD